VPAITLTYFAAVRAAAGGATSETYEADSVSAAQAAAIAAHGAELKRLFSISSFLINGKAAAQSDLAAPVTQALRVDVLPPFAGG